MSWSIQPGMRIPTARDGRFSPFSTTSSSSQSSLHCSFVSNLCDLTSAFSFSCAHFAQTGRQQTRPSLFFSVASAHLRKQWADSMCISNRVSIFFGAFRRNLSHPFCCSCELFHSPYLVTLFICHSYENTGGVHHLFPIWNSTLVTRHRCTCLGSSLLT